jgi:hypothetical protein
MGWIDQAKRISVEQVAKAGGLEIRKKGSVRGFTCPAHGEDHSDGRPSGRIVHAGKGWRCWSCDASGDSVSLASWLVLGSAKPERSEWPILEDWFQRQGFVTAEPEATEPEGPKRLPLEEVSQLWRNAWPAFTEPRALRWFYARGLDAWKALDFCRSLYEGQECPSWARCAGEPWSSGHALLLPCVDASGSLVGLRARWVGAEWNWLEDRWTEISHPRKEISPRGAGVLRGTVYAGPLGQSLLRGARPSGWSGEVVIVEGGPCWLRYASEAAQLRSGNQDAPIMLGVWSGAWPDGRAGDQLASRLRGARVVVATDSDASGNKYAQAIAATLRRCGVAGVRVQ